MTDDDDKLRQAVRQAASGGKASCKSLLAIAERLGVPPARVGRACDELKVKIAGCQLGCFR